MQTTGFTNYTEFSYLDGDKRGAVIDILTGGLYEQTNRAARRNLEHSFQKTPDKDGSLPR